MKCFYHRDVDAVGICKNCAKGVCPACAAELPIGLACKRLCESAVLARLPEVKDYTKDQVQYIILGLVAASGAIYTGSHSAFGLILVMTSIASFGLFFRTYKNRKKLQSKVAVSSVHEDHLETTFSQLEKRKEQ